MDDLLREFLVESAEHLEGLGGVRQCFEARQAEKPARPLDGVDEPEDVAQDLLVIGVLFETDQLRIDGVQILAAVFSKQL
jgi:hypothetical protein